MKRGKIGNLIPRRRGSDVSGRLFVLWDSTGLPMLIWRLSFGVRVSDNLSTSRRAFVLTEIAIETWVHFPQFVHLGFS